MHCAWLRITLYHYLLHFLAQYIIRKTALCELPFYCSPLVFAKPLQCTRGGYFMAFQRNNDMEVEHAVHTTLRWVCLTHSPVEPVHYASLHNTLFYLMFISHRNNMDQVLPNVSYCADEIKFFIELGLSWFPTIKSIKRGMHNLNL